MAKGQRRGQLTLAQVPSEPDLSETVRQVAASLDLAATAAQSKTVAITSSGAGDGRSTLAACLGAALSSHWREVILVDSDFRHPSLHQHFHLDNSLGLSNLLSNPDLELADVIQSTTYPRLRVITCGEIPTDPTTLIRCPRMSWVLERLRESAEMVLIDTPPSLNSADGMLLASQVDAVVLAVNANQTRQDSTEATLENLRRANRNILGFIWNQMDTGLFNAEARNILGLSRDQGLTKPHPAVIPPPGRKTDLNQL